MQRIELELSTVTPAFIGTADPAKSAEWTGKSVRGHLRWWLRAVLGGELGGRAQAVREAEEGIFGSTKRKSALRIMARPFEGKESGDRADGVPLNETDLAGVWGVATPAVLARLRLTRGASNPIAYLGYGPILYDPDKRATLYGRARIRPPQKLELLLQWDNGMGPHLDSLRKALWCWLNLGGIGGRTRRGFGSLACTTVRMIAGNEGLIEPVETFKQFQEELKRHLGNTMSIQAPAAWSHFTSETRVYVSAKPLKKDWTWEDALMAAGAWLIAFRRRYGISSDERGDGVKDRDYVWLKGTAPAGGVPDRAGFGLPLPFGRGDYVAAWRQAARGRRGETQQTGRRASPLLIHVTRFGSDHRLVFTHMPAQLIPNDAQIHFRGTQSLPTTGQIGIVGAFLTDLETKKKVEEIFP